MNGRVLPALGAVAVLIAYASAGVQYHLTALALDRLTPALQSADIVEALAPDAMQAATGFFSRWTAQYLIVVAVSATLAVAVLFTRTALTRTLLWAAQLGLFLLTAYADTHWMLAQLSVLIALVIQAHLLFPLRKAALLSVVAATGLFAMPRAASAWGLPITVYAADRIAAMAVYAALLLAGSSVLHFVLDALASERRLSRQLNQSVLQLTSANVGFQDYAATAEQRSSLEERNRITREVHDSIGYTLTNVVVMMEAAQGLIEVDPARLRQTLILARTQAQDTLAEIRRTLRALRTVAPPTRDALDVLEKLFRTFETATSVRVNVEYRNLPSAPRSTIDAVVYRTVQEGLTNAFRHGRATDVTVLFWYDGGSLSISIRDNGVGTVEIKDGIGLRGMRERIEPLGGTVHAAGLQGGGFELRVRIPVRRSDVATHATAAG